MTNCNCVLCAVISSLLILIYTHDILVDYNGVDIYLLWEKNIYGWKKYAWSCSIHGTPNRSWLVYLELRLPTVDKNQCWIMREKVQSKIDAPWCWSNEEKKMLLLWDRVKMRSTFAAVKKKYSRYETVSKIPTVSKSGVLFNSCLLEQRTYWQCILTPCGTLSIRVRGVYIGTFSSASSTTAWAVT